jgi:Trafficking protein particle complex subunit 10, TRAPPC10
VSDGDLLSYVFDCNVGETRNDASLSLRDDAEKALSLELGLDLPELVLSAHGALKFLKMKRLPFTLEVPWVTGPVRKPLTLKYIFDWTDMEFVFDRKNIQINYSISSDSSSWLVGGKTKGTVCCDEGTTRFSCEVLGIPVVAGVLRRFPRVALMHV